MKRRPNDTTTGRVPEGTELPDGQLRSPDGFVCTIHDRARLWHRPDGTDDAGIITEGYTVFNPVPWPSLVGGTVLDLGAHIGTFMARALRNGMAKVVAVEPDPDNYWLLEQNMALVIAELGIAGHEVVPHRAAVNDSGNDEVLYRNVEGVGKCMHSLYTKGRKEPMVVPGISFDRLLADHEPSFVKVDVEYSEYHLAALTALPDFVRVLFVELHLNGGDHRAQGRRLADSFTAQGFRELRSPHFTDKNWHTVPVYAR